MKNYIKKSKKEFDEKRGKVRTIIIAVMIAVLIFMIGIGISDSSKGVEINKSNIVSKRENRVVESIISLDVNPSIEISVDDEERVINVVALNKEGEKTIDSVNFFDLDLDDAIHKIFNSMVKNGYISSDANSVLVSVENRNSLISKRIKKDISEEINEALKESNIEGAVILQEYEDKDKDDRALVEEYHISYGKAKLISKIIDKKIKDVKGNLITGKQLAQMSINELKLLIESKQIKLDNVISNGKASYKAYIGEENAKNIALNDAKLEIEKVSMTEIDMDYDDGLMVYEVDFVNNNVQYEYKVNAKTGVIIDKDVENKSAINDDLDDQDSELDYDDDDVNDRQRVIIKKDSSKQNSQSSSEKLNTNNYISKSKAKNIAFSNAGVQLSSAHDVSVELDEDDGKMVYEIDFESGRKEYEYTIDAVTGTVLESSIED